MTSKKEKAGSPGPLAGVTVIEHATVLLGPLIGQILGDLGADVIKVEGDVVDAGRLMGSGPHPELSGIALNLLRNKRSIRVDLKSDAGRQVLMDLIGRADVFLTNARPSSLENLRLSYDDVGSTNPQLVYLEAHGYRSDTSEANRAAFDDVIQGEVGLPMLQAAVGLGVTYFPMVLADMVSGLTATYAVLAGLVKRGLTGMGGRIEVPMLDSALAFVLTEHLSGATMPGGTTGHARILTPFRRPHRTIDGYISILPYSDRDWRSLYTAAGRDAELSDPRFKTRESRNQHPEYVYESLGQLARSYLTQDLLDICRNLDVPASSVNSLEDIVADPAKHRSTITNAMHPVVGEYLSIASPAIFDGERAKVRRHAPLVGEHTVEILQGLGYARKRIETLLSDGVIAESMPVSATSA
ncbi:CaiB/BaiF CoA transferase family protein [Jatrophihabitans sp. DSM 45814]